MKRIVIPPLYDDGLVLAEKLDERLNSVYRALNGGLELGSIAEGTKFPAGSFQESSCRYLINAGKENDDPDSNTDSGSRNVFPLMLGSGTPFYLHALGVSYEPLAWGQSGHPLTFTVTRTTGGLPIAEVTIADDGTSYSAYYALPYVSYHWDEDLIVTVTPALLFNTSPSPSRIKSVSVSALVSDNEAYGWP